jgi:hypothetical protein
MANKVVRHIYSSFIDDRSIRDFKSFIFSKGGENMDPRLNELDWLLRAANIRVEDATGVVRVFYSYTA